MLFSITSTLTQYMCVRLAWDYHETIVRLSRDYIRTLVRLYWDSSETDYRETNSKTIYKESETIVRLIYEEHLLLLDLQKKKPQIIWVQCPLILMFSRFIFNVFNSFISFIYSVNLSHVLLMPFIMVHNSLVYGTGYNVISSLTLAY